MIPVQILSAKVTMEDGGCMEASVQELSVFGMEIFMPKENMSPVVKVELHFFLEDSMEYERFCTTNLSVEMEQEKFYNRYRIYVEDDRYEQLVKRFTKNYTEFVQSKLNLTDEQHAKKWCDYPPKEKVTYAIPKAPDYGLALEDPEAVQRYLENGVTKNINPLTKLYLGNSFCIHLQPDQTTVIKVVEKAKRDGLEVIFVLSVTAECFYEQQMELLQWLNDHYDGMEVLVNDLGIFYEATKKFSHLKIRKGILLYKKSKDPRKGCLRDGQSEPIFDETKKEIYYPYYQMNTATFCTLYAGVRDGKRSKNHRVKRCTNLCLSYQFHYGKDLPIVGRYNGIFGISTCDKSDKTVVING